MILVIRRPDRSAHHARVDAAASEWRAERGWGEDVAVERPVPGETRADHARRRNGGFWSARTVAWYQRALARSDYATRILGAIDLQIAGVASVLDVGAGCGALALPLAERVPRVTALEPAPAMTAALRAEAERRGLRRLTVVEAAWSDAVLPPHDLVLCAHVGELTRPGARFPADAARWARRWVVVVRDREAESDKLFFRELYPALLGRPYGGGSDYGDMLAGLADLGVHAKVVAVDYRSDQPFANLDEACDFYEAYLGVSGPEARGFLRTFLAARLVREPEGWVAPYSKRAVVLRWPGAAGGD